MNTQDGENSGGLSLLEAVEALSEIAELDLETKAKGVKSRVLRIDGASPEETVEKVKSTFKVILNFLRDHYSHQSHYIFDSQSVEGIKTIMVLVGEAAKKLDRYNAIFQAKSLSSVTEMNEYKKLQEFYLARVVKPSFNQSLLSRWILGLGVSHKTPEMLKSENALKLIVGPHARVDDEEKVGQKIHVMDLEAVKKDYDYELFFIRRADGSRFYSPRLLRNVKLVCDFGESLSDIRGVDPIDSVAYWEDRAYQQMASGMLGAIRTPLNRFFKELCMQKDEALFAWVTKSLMALMLAANPANTLKNEPVKCSKDYFRDFQKYLRDFLSSRSYQNLIAYPKKVMGALQQSLLDLVGAVLKALYCGAGGYQRLEGLFSEVIREGETKPDLKGSFEFRLDPFQEMPLTAVLEKASYALNALVRKHQAGPLTKVLNQIERDPFSAFDPLAQDNLPESLFNLSFKGRDVLFTRMASPVIQEVEDKASVGEEFRAYLRFANDETASLKTLFYNCQNRASWREFARCQCLEEIASSQEFSSSFQILSIPKQTEFYEQTGPYVQMNRTDEFFDSLVENLSDAGKGYFASEGLQSLIKKEEIEGILKGVLKLFFSGRNVMTKDARGEFLDFIHVLMLMKCIDAWGADVVALSSKDGLDEVLGDAALLFAFFKMIESGDEWSDADWKEIFSILSSPVLLIRERCMHADKFARFIRAFKSLERTYREMGKAGFMRALDANFGRFFPNGILTSSVQRSKL